MTRLLHLGFMSILLFMVPAAWADSILDIPKGTVFELLEELEVPANRDFALLGQSELDETFNATGQVLNDMNDRPLVNAGSYAAGSSYLTFYTYYHLLFESYEKTYVNCLERHRVYARVSGASPSAPIVIQQGQVNVAVINNSSGSSDEIYSAIGENYCIQPDHMIAALVIDRKTADGGGFFAEGYRFNVRDVRWQRGNDYNVVKIMFDHKILQGLVIVTTHDPETIPMSALSGESSSGDGFWASVGSALADMVNIGGGYFSIELPGKRYYE